MRVLMLTSEWPTPQHPHWVPFLVQQVEYLRKAGVEVEVFSFRGAKNPFNYLKAWLKARKKLKEQSYDLIHAQWGQSALLALPKRLPLVITFHGSDVQGEVSANGAYTARGWLLRQGSAWGARFADEMIAVSPLLQQRIKPIQKRVHVIPGGLNLDLFQPLDQRMARRELALPPLKKLVLFGGRPEMPVKRYALAHNVIQHVRARGIEVELIVLDKVPHAQIPLYLNACDALLLTSLHEGSPTIIKEALACNLPIVSTDVGDVRARLEPIEGCIVCADDTPQALAAALEQVLARQTRIDGRRHVLELDERLQAQKIIAVYRRAL